MTPDLIPEFSKFTLKPDDVLVLKCKYRLDEISKPVLNEYLKKIRKCFPKNKVILLDTSMDLEIYENNN